MYIFVKEHLEYMVRKISIKNFKSVQNLELELGRINVFIGANGSGKSNILEAIAFGSAAVKGDLGKNFLASRGIRINDPILMRSAFESKYSEDPIRLTFFNDDSLPIHFQLVNDNKPYSQWKENGNEIKEIKRIQNFAQILEDDIKRGYTKSEEIDPGIDPFPKLFFYEFFRKFIIYSPEETALRNFQSDSQIEPLGINGAGLFKLLKVFSQYDEGKLLEELKSHLGLIDWFEDFQISNGSFSTERFLQIKDQYLNPDLAYFDQRSANEGFLFLLFYLALFISPDTPPFFAIDNIENALNPKLCSELILLLNKLSKDHNKQVIFTTHSPTVLDGLDLNDDEQRLFVINRNSLGHTKAHRISAKPNQNGIKLSEAFVKGFIGGLPDNF